MNKVSFVTYELRGGTAIHVNIRFGRDQQDLLANTRHTLQGEVRSKQMHQDATTKNDVERSRAVRDVIDAAEHVPQL